MTYFDARPNDIFRRPTKWHLSTPDQMTPFDTRRNKILLRHMTYFERRPNDIFRCPTNWHSSTPHQIIYFITPPIDKSQYPTKLMPDIYVKPDEMTYFDAIPDQMIYFDAPPNDIFGGLTKSHIWMADKVTYLDAQRHGIFWHPIKWPYLKPN